MFLTVLACAVFAGLDAYLSYRRMRKYGFRAELDPVARQLAEDFGPWAGTAFTIALNVVLLSLIVAFDWERFLYALLGAKIAFSACQLKSLQVEMFLDRLLAARRK